MPRFLIDLHCHTREKSFDGMLPAVEIARRLHHQGFNGVVFTDHEQTWSEKELSALREEAGLPPMFFLAAGQEVRVNVGEQLGGDLLVYGPKEDFPDGTPVDEVLDAVKETGGFCIAAHAAAHRIGFGPHLGDYPVHAIETWNGRYGNRIAQKSEIFAERYKLPSVGGSDTHQDEDVGGGGTEFPELPQTLDDLTRLVTAGHCKPWKPSMKTRVFQWLSREVEG